MQQTHKLAGAVLATLLVAAPFAARAQVSLDVNIAPPAPRYEVVPAPRVGFVWAPGYWRWNANRWGWNGGRWIAARAGFHWAPDVWVARGPGWHYVPGHWVR